MSCKIAAKIRISDNSTIAFNDPVRNFNPPDAHVHGVEHINRSESYNTAHAIQYALTATVAMHTYKLLDNKLCGGHRVVIRCCIDVVLVSGMCRHESLEADHPKLPTGISFNHEDYGKQGRFRRAVRMEYPDLRDGETTASAAVHDMSAAWRLDVCWLAL